MGYLLSSVPLLALTTAGAGAADAAAAADFDVVVFGSTPAGIAAATAAGQLGCTVALYEPLPMIGGMVSLHLSLSTVRFFTRSYHHQSTSARCVTV